MWRNWLAVLLLCAPAAAQIDSPSRVGVGVIKRKLSLADAIEMALKKNLEIEIEKTNISVAAQSVHGAHGYLDPRFRWAPRYENRQIPTSSPLVGANGKLVEKVGSQTFSWSQRLPWWGMGIQAQFENDRQSTTNPFTSLSPYQTGRLGASLTLPLLRNRKTDPARANLRITNKQKELSETQFRLKVIDVVSRVEEAYWNLVAARQSVRVASEAVKLAREQLARTRRMIESGTLAPVELAAAEAELERRVDTWYSSIGLVTEVENALKLLITENRQEPLWDDEIIPTEERTLEPPRVDDVRAAVRSALQKRPELRQIGLRLETNDIQARLARNQTRPEVNVVAGYTVAGLAGTLSSTENPFSKLSGAQFLRTNELSEIHGLPPLPAPSFGGVVSTQIGGFGSVLSAIGRGTYPTAFVGLQMDFVGRNRAAEAEAAKAAIAERRLKLQRDQLEEAIEAQVRNALQQIQTARQRIAATEASVRAAEERLQSEIRLFRSGESTNFLVLTRQNELADSQRRAVVAKLDFNKAVARVRKALGTTLETYRIELQ